MSRPNEITDENFVPFLHSLGVETYKKSFEWMLNDSTFAGVFSWLYTNLDHNNALSAREEYRYSELQKKNHLLSLEDLEATLSSIQQEYPGISLPGDHESLEDVKTDICMQKEKLQVLEKQERMLKDLVKQNEQVKEQLGIEITKLNSAHQQCLEDESTTASECLTLAEEVETLTEGVVDVIAGALDVYANCHYDKELSKKFISFGPLEAYRQSQSLFRSHFDLYTSRKFGKRQNDSLTDEDLRIALAEAKSLEDRLKDAATSYIESKAELCGEQAKLALVSNYNNVHPSQITSLTLEAQSALELLMQEEAILDQELRAGVTQLAHSRTRVAVDTATRCALDVREQMLSDLSHLLEVSHQALSLDRLLYCALRKELRTIEECAQFAHQLQMHLVCEGRAVSSRIESMSEITRQQETALSRLPQTDLLLHTIHSILGCKPDDVGVLVKVYGDLVNKVKELREDVKGGYNLKEQHLEDFKTSVAPLRAYIFNGCTKQPNCSDRTVTSLTHSLKQELERVEKNVLDLGGRFTSVKTGDKHNLRKLWQWFLTDASRLRAASHIKGTTHA